MAWAFFITEQMRKPVCCQARFPTVFRDCFGFGIVVLRCSICDKLETGSWNLTLETRRWKPDAGNPKLET
jgi:hypothetical protein